MAPLPSPGLGRLGQTAPAPAVEARVTVLDFAELQLEREIGAGSFGKASGPLTSRPAPNSLDTSASCCHGKACCRGPYRSPGQLPQVFLARLWQTDVAVKVLQPTSGSASLTRPLWEQLQQVGCTIARMSSSGSCLCKRCCMASRALSTTSAWILHACANLALPSEEQRLWPTPPSRCCLHPRVMQEASLLARLRHPCVVQLLAICADPPALVSEYCARGSLADVLRSATESPQAAAQLQMARRLGMVSMVSQ